MKSRTLESLHSLGWHVEERQQEPLHLPETLQQRYLHLPQAATNFLSKLSLCCNADATAWFLSQADYEGTSDSAFRWNEFELMEMELAEAAHDVHWQKQIKTFWDFHFPFLLSVKSGYAFFALCLHHHNFGAVVHGVEPEFIEVSEVAPSFEAFLTSLVEAVGNSQAAGTLQTAC